MPWIYRPTARSRDPDEVGKMEALYRVQRAKVSQHASAARLAVSELEDVAFVTPENFLGEERMEPAIFLE